MEIYCFQTRRPTVTQKQVGGFFGFGDDDILVDSQEIEATEATRTFDIEKLYPKENIF